jgi:hypothetical protein
LLKRLEKIEKLQRAKHLSGMGQSGYHSPILDISNLCCSRVVESERKSYRIKNAHPCILTFPRFTGAWEKSLKGRYVLCDGSRDSVLGHGSQVRKLRVNLSPRVKDRFEHTSLRYLSYRFVQSTDTEGPPAFRG